MKPCVNTVADIAEKYCIYTLNDKLKHFENILVYAVDSWNELLRGTLASYELTWLNTFAGSKYPYVELPKNHGRFIQLYQEDSCNRLVPVTRSQDYSVIPKPAKKNCGCTVDCQCGELCSAANSMSMTTKEVVINNVPYVEKQWTEVCKNGDLKIYREVPTLEGSDVIIMEDFKVVCKLQTKTCGCLIDNESNRSLLFEYCGCMLGPCTSLNLHSTNRAKPCETELQFGEDRRIYLIGREIKEWYLLQHQIARANGMSPVPDYAEKVLMASIDHRSKMFNPRVAPIEKREAKYAYRDAIDEMIMELNPVDMEFLARLENQQRQL